MNPNPPTPNYGRSIAVGRFLPDGPTGYRSAFTPISPVRRTREEAEADARQHLGEQT